MAEPRFLQLYQSDARAVRDELAAGLAAPVAHVAPKFLYDALGSRLFDAITELDEYDPTRVERSIFDTQGAALARATGTGLTLVDLGAGSCDKAARLLPVLQPAAYVAVDISVQHLRQALGHLAQRHPGLPMLGLGLDFSSTLALPAECGSGPRLMFYPGSSIGNFTPDAAQAFLQQAHAASQGGALLIGVDLVKDSAVLERAYDDPLGVTAAFNLNLLLNVNRLLGSNFDVRQWQHVALYNAARSRIEMHLQAHHALALRWPGGERAFAPGERLHTENSYKYTPQSFQALLQAAGWQQVQLHTDPAAAFAVFSARAVG
jgi:dimethylhistidine N-methyltransferase